MVWDTCMVSSHTRTRSSHMVTIQGLGHPIQVSSHKCQEPCECWEFHNSRVPSVAGSTDHGVTAIHSRIRLIQGGTFQPLAGTELTSVDECSSTQSFAYGTLVFGTPSLIHQRTDSQLETTKSQGERGFKVPKRCRDPEYVDSKGDLTGTAVSE